MIISDAQDETVQVLNVLTILHQAKLEPGDHMLSI